jgi:hypothetical protein
LNGSAGAFDAFAVDTSGAGAAFDDDDSAAAFGAVDLDRAGGSSGTPGGVREELRPGLGLLLGAGATTTASGGSAGLEPVRSFFSAFPTDVEAGRFGAGCSGTTSAATLDELAFSGGLREALLLLALAFAAGGCAEGSLLAALGFAALASAAAAAAVSRFGTEAALGTEAARAFLLLLLLLPLLLLLVLALKLLWELKLLVLAPASLALVLVPVLVLGSLSRFLLDAGLAS